MINCVLFLVLEMPRRVSTPVIESPKKRFASNGVRLPDPIREGELLTDIAKKTWRLGRSVGLGGFGEIYLASDDTRKPVGQDAKYVIKVEPHKNGPLFVEMNFYIRVAKIEMIDAWVAKNGVKALGMPYYVGGGSHFYNGERYRFLVLPRFGQDVQKLFLKNHRKLHVKTAFTLASYIVDTLEYIHSHDYIHADIKGSNLLLGLSAQAPVYLVDFGLACRYKDRNGRHKEYRHDERRAHDGTIEYTSRDAHIGVHSRRGDLEILGYNLVQWLTGKLPWEDDLSDPEAVAESKKRAMSNIGQFLKSVFAPNNPPEALYHYLQYVSHLGFETKPDYKYCKRLFSQAIYDAGYKDDGKLSFDGKIAKRTVKKARKRLLNEEPENRQEFKPRKIFLPQNRKPCAARNFNRITRNTANGLPCLRSRDFDWTAVLSGDPEKMLKKEKEKPSRYSFIQKPELENSGVEQTETSIPQNLDNPTPAMKQILARMRQRLKEQQTANGGFMKKSKSDRYDDEVTTLFSRLLRY